jgi:hypothetical protein
MARYTPIPKIKSPNGKQMYQTVRYPEVPRQLSDVYVYTTIGDRFDTLAQQYKRINQQTSTSTSTNRGGSGY